MIFARLILLSILVALTTSHAFSQGKGKGKGKGKGAPETEVAVNPGPAGGFTTTITAIDGSQITYQKPVEGAPSMMRGGKGKGKGRFRSSTSGPDETKTLSERALITSATTTRRTGEMIIGIELGGGIRNKVFENVSESGVSARLVIKDDKIVEINVLIAADDSETPIAVKPKRPPMKP